MGLWQRIRDHFITDIEVVLEQPFDAPFREVASSTVGGGALSTFGQANRLRWVFHGGHPGNGTHVVLENACGDRLTIRRTSSGSVKLDQHDPRAGTQRGTSVDVSIGGTVSLRLGGLSFTVRRFRHKYILAFFQARPAA